MLKTNSRPKMLAIQRKGGRQLLTLRSRPNRRTAWQKRASKSASAMLRFGCPMPAISSPEPASGSCGSAAPPKGAANAVPAAAVGVTAGVAVGVAAAVPASLAAGAAAPPGMPAAAAALSAAASMAAAAAAPAEPPISEAEMLVPGRGAERPARPSGAPTGSRPLAAPPSGRGGSEPKLAAMSTGS